MNPRILTLLQNHNQLNISDINCLEKEIELYPYMQSLRALHLKALHQYQPEVYKNSLSKTAIYTTDKKILHHLLFGDKIKTAYVKETTPDVVQTQTIATENPKLEEVDSRLEQEQFHRLQEELLQEKEVEIAKNEVFITEDKPETLVETSIEIPVETPILVEKTEEKEALASFVQNKQTTIVAMAEDETKMEKKEEHLEDKQIAIDERISHPTDIDAIPDAIIETTHIDEDWTPLSTENTSNHRFRNRNIPLTEQKPEEKQMILETPEETTELVSEEVIADHEEKPLIALEPIRFSVKDFLQPMPISKSGEDVNETTEALQDSTSVAISEQKQVSNVPSFINNWKHWLQINQSPTNPEAILVKKAQVIDQFIEKNPKINKVKDDTDSNIPQIIKDRGDDISHLMTDTLAQMYIQQSYYAKAINAYGILMEKFPEKKTLYLEKIEEIKQLRHNKS